MKKIFHIFLPLKAQFDRRWQNLASREQQYLRLMFVFIGVAIIYFGVYQPMNKALIELQQAVGYQKSVLQNIQPKILEIKSLQGSNVSNSAIDPSNTLSVVDDNLKQNQLKQYASEISQTNSSGVQIKFSNISFDLMTQWLLGLWKQYRIQVTQIDVQSSKTMGNVDVLIVLQSS